MVTPNGIGTDATWNSLLAGESNVGLIEQFETTDEYPSRIAAEIKNFDPAQFMPKKKVKEVCRFITFSMAATKLAIEASGLELSDAQRERTGVFIGVWLGGLENPS
jgi:3-oxoacyl-[acyl-carrier-protein] synthase II